MTKTIQLTAAVVAMSLPLSLLSGCAPKVLSFGTETSSAPLDVDGGQIIADLSETEASQVCAWLIATYPDTQNEPDISRWSIDNDGGGYIAIVDGYTGGGGYGCTVPTAPQIMRVFLPQSLCVENLQHAPCQATVAELQQCVEYFNANFANLDTLDCATAWQVCSPYLTAASCDQTVFQAAPAAAYGCSNMNDVYGGLLPVEPDGQIPLAADAAADGACAN
jgi:hypothetical protein